MSDSGESRQIAARKCTLLPTAEHYTCKSQCCMQQWRLGSAACNNGGEQ